MAKLDRTISFDKDLYKWLTEYVKTIRPATTIPKYINWLVEKEKQQVDTSPKQKSRFVVYSEDE